MEISLSLNLTPSTPSLSTRHPPRSFSFSSSNSTFFSARNSLFNRTNQKPTSLVLGKSRTRTQRGKKGFSCNALFGLGVPELAVIAGVAALVFGPKKLPEVGKSIGKTVKSFQQVGF